MQVGYLSQHAEELGVGGPPGQSVVEAAQRASGLTPNKARALLGRFLFSGEEAEKPLDGLSGGERRRLSLAILVQSGANVLILDEPTNHLDIESREALEDALGGFEGALLLVSHDRALLDAVGTRTVALEDGELHCYVGGWPEYVRVREERAAGGAAAPAPARSPLRRRARTAVAATASPRAGTPTVGPDSERRGREDQRRGGEGERPARRRAVEEPPARTAEGRACGRGGGSRARRTRKRARRSGRLGEQVRDGQERGPAHRGQARGRGGLRPPRTLVD